jgi:hypothetical protein
MDVIRMIKSGWSVVPSDRCWKRDLGYCGKCDIGDEGEAMAGDPMGDIPELVKSFCLLLSLAYEGFNDLSCLHVLYGKSKGFCASYPIEEPERRKSITRKWVGTQEKGSRGYPESR